MLRTELSHTDIEALTAFCVDNTDLDQLESMLAEFNVFEAVGMVREEIRHSRFLSFLLDPKSPHGLGDMFVTRVLQAAVNGRPPDDVGVTALDLELMDLGDVQVACEIQRIDILMLSEQNRFAVVVENKVGSQEHSDQLSRYLASVESMRPGWRVLPILLSPQGTEPTDERYCPVSYENVATILSSILATRRATLGPDISLALTHYERLLRRHVVSDSKLNELCQQIIAKHRKALELLIEHMGDPKSQVRLLTDMVFEEAGFVATGNSWLPEGWSSWVPPSSESVTGYILALWVEVKGKRARLVLEIEPGPSDKRSALFVAARSSKLFKVRPNMTPKWTRIFIQELPRLPEAQDEEEKWQDGVRRQLQHFATEVAPEMEQVLRQALDVNQVS